MLGGLDLKLTTERLTLRTIERDPEAIAQTFAELKAPLMHDKAVFEYLSVIACEEVEEVFGFVHINQGDQLFFIIEDINSGEFIGFIKGMQSDAKRGLELCYFCEETRRGKGYIAEALKVYIKYVKSNFKQFDTMYFYIRHDNVASQSVMGKIGAKPIDSIITPINEYFLLYAINLKEEE